MLKPLVCAVELNVKLISVRGNQFQDRTGRVAQPRKIPARVLQVLLPSVRVCVKAVFPVTVRIFKIPFRRIREEFRFRESAVAVQCVRKISADPVVRKQERYSVRQLVRACDILNLRYRGFMRLDKGIYRKPVRLERDCRTPAGLFRPGDLNVFKHITGLFPVCKMHDVQVTALFPVRQSDLYFHRCGDFYLFSVPVDDPDIQ